MLAIERPKNRPKSRRAPELLVVLVLLLPAAVTVSCSRCEGADSEADGMASPFDPERPDSHLTPPAQRAALGTWASVDDYRMRVLETQECDVEDYFAPQPGHTKIGVLVEVEGRTEIQVPVNALHASLTDSAGRTYEPTLAGCRPALPAGRVRAGERARGFVTFEIPEAAAGLVFQYEPVIIGRASAALRFDLDR